MPGSLRWWQDTALITLAGVALAVWLWDGWPFAFVWIDTAVADPPQVDLGDYFDAGCLTAENLRAMAEGQATRVRCPDTRVLETVDGPPQNRLFP
ncbi:MAG: hypothetical protein Gyms2KO_40310 [Gymnodinialimonas sp.]